MPMSTKMPMSPTATLTCGLSGCTAGAAGLAGALAALAAAGVAGCTTAGAAALPGGAAPTGLAEDAAGGAQAAASTTSRSPTRRSEHAPDDRRIMASPSAYGGLPGSRRALYLRTAPTGHGGRWAQYTCRYPCGLGVDRH